MKISDSVVFLTTAVLVGLVFWIFQGHHLTYDVGSAVNGEYTFSHTEDFSTLGRIIISILVGLLGGFLFAILSSIISHRMSHTEPTAPTNASPFDRAQGLREPRR